MPFHLDSPWGATLMPLSVRDGLGTEQNIEFGYKIPGPILSCLWTSVDEILGQCRGHLALFSTSRFIQKIFAIKSGSRRKSDQM